MKKKKTKNRREKKSAFKPHRKADEKMWKGLYSELLSIQDELDGFLTPLEVNYSSRGLVLKRAYNRSHRLCYQFLEKDNTTPWQLFIEYCQDELRVKSVLKAARAGPFSLCLKALHDTHFKKIEKRSDFDVTQKEFLNKFLLIDSRNRYTYSAAMSVIYAAEIKPKGFEKLFAGKNLTEISRYGRSYLEVETLPASIIEHSHYLRQNFNDKVDMKNYVDGRLKRLKYEFSVY